MNKLQATLSPDQRNIEIFVPMTFKRIGGRKLIVAPDGAAWQQPDASTDGNMVRMIVRAYRWRRQLEDGTYASLSEIAAAEKVTVSFISRVLRLTLLAPDLVEAVLAGTQPRSLQMVRLFKPFPIEWEKQRTLLGFAAGYGFRPSVP